jgi:hypothetical protein
MDKIQIYRICRHETSPMRLELLKGNAGEGMTGWTLEFSYDSNSKGLMLRLPDHLTVIDNCVLFPLCQFPMTAPEIRDVTGIVEYDYQVRPATERATREL